MRIDQFTPNEVILHTKEKEVDVLLNLCRSPEMQFNISI